MLLMQKYNGVHGFYDIQHYLYDRYSVLSDQYQNTRRYVSLHRDNRYAFSDEFASIMLSAGAVFGSAMHELLKVAARTPKGQSNMGHYSRLLLDDIPGLDSYSVHVRAHHPKGLLLPFQGMTKRTPPKWWYDYNKLKHSNQPDYRVGNMENCLNSIAAVLLLRYFVGERGTDSIFANVGQTFDHANPGRRRATLFLVEKRDMNNAGDDIKPRNTTTLSLTSIGQARVSTMR